MKTNQIVNLSELSFYVLKKDVVIQIVERLIEMVEYSWNDSDYVQQSQMKNDSEEFKKYLRNILRSYTHEKLEIYEILNSSGYVEDTFYPTNNNFIDFDRLLGILGPEFLNWKSTKSNRK